MIERWHRHRRAGVVRLGAGPSTSGETCPTVRTSTRRPTPRTAPRRPSSTISSTSASRRPSAEAPPPQREPLAARRPPLRPAARPARAPRRARRARAARRCWPRGCAAPPARPPRAASHARDHGGVPCLARWARGWSRPSLRRCSRAPNPVRPRLDWLAVWGGGWCLYETVWECGRRDSVRLHARVSANESLARRCICRRWATSPTWGSSASSTTRRGGTVRTRCTTTTTTTTTPQAGSSTTTSSQAPSPPPRTKWTRRVPHPVLIGHAASLTPY